MHMYSFIIEQIFLSMLDKINNIGVKYILHTKYINAKYIDTKYVYEKD